MRPKTFLLGVGCQKGGTTWLHDYLHGHPSCDFGFAKEYHVFDTIYFQPFRYHAMKRDRDEFLKKRAVAPPKRLPGIDRRIAALTDQIGFCDDPATYAAYFSTLWETRAEISLVGDITPSYCGLDAEQFGVVRALIESAGFNVKVVFVLRDPIERTFSMLRMILASKKQETVPGADELGVMFTRLCGKTRSEFRSRYETTIANIDKAFDAGQIHLAFYETLFNDDSIRALTDFLGIEFVSPDFERRLNASRIFEELPDAAIRAARQHYDLTYSYCMQRFGEEKIARIWPNAALSPAVDTP
jgi:Sulfotransferase family